LAFVHAGIDPAKYPHCPDQLRLWTRSQAFFDSRNWPARPELAGLLVVHGHTPTEDFAAEVQKQRINIDTGACFGGPLTSVVLAPQEAPRFLSA
jgi:serine/threonine protein phosphatase 1